jgi:hypothetical protein
MRIGAAWVGGLAALAVGSGVAAAQERLILEAYPSDPPASAAWQVVTDKDLGGRFYVEMMPADQTPSDYRDILAAASFPHIKASAAQVLQGTLKQFEPGQQCEGLTANGPRVSQEQGRTVAYAQAYCGQETGQAFGVQIFYKAIEGDDGVYVVSRDFRVPPSKVGGALSFAEGQQDQALALMKAVGAANAWLANSVYLCGPASKDARCARPAPAGAQVLVSGGELDALAKSAAYQTMVSKAVAAAPPEVTKGCTAPAVDRSSILVLKPISFAADGRPYEGAWKQSFPQAGCGEATTLNFLFTATADQRIRTLILVPGDDIADPQVQVEAFRSALASVKAAAPSCQALHVLNTRFEAFDHSKASGPDPAPGAKVDIPWRETWTLGGCGAAWNVAVAFTPGGGATQVAAGAATPRP